MKKLLCMMLCLLMLAAAFTGCAAAPSQAGDPTPAPTAAQTADAGDAAGAQDQTAEKTSLKVGTFSSSGIAAEAGVAALEEMGYEVEVVYFDDAVLPNTALQEGSIDYNIFQHTPYLEAYMKDNPGVDLSMALLLYYPNYGLYSTKYATLDELPENAKIGLYSDASNVDRGLRILNACGLIKLTDEKKDIYSELDIVENPKNITFELVGFGTAVRALEDLDACMAAASHILAGGLDPKAALVLEEKEHTSADFTCGITVRTEDLESKWLKDVIAAYTSETSREYINENYKGASVPVF